MATINALNIIPCKTDYCPTMWNTAKKKGMTVKKGSERPGDIVMYDFNHNGTPDHTGIVVGLGSSRIIAVEGNTGSGSNTNGGQVQKRERAYKDILGFIRPKYNSVVTASMVVATAMSQLGVKESPKNSNKVKYNVWFYGSNKSAFWCCTFVCWNFGNVQDIPVVTKPTGKYSGAIAKPTLQKGAKGSEVKTLQKFLNWYHAAWKLEADGDFGGLTEAALQSFQKTEGLDPDGVYGKLSQGKANAYKAAAVATPQPYKGGFPTLPKPEIIECTRSVNGMRRHGLIKGDYILRFKSEERRYKMCKFSLATVSNKKITYSNHPKFEDKVKAFGYNLAKVKALKTSANCSNFVDGAVGAVCGKYVRDLGAKKNKAALAKTNFFYSYTYSKAALLAGDICGTKEHTWMIIQGSALSVGCQGLDVKRWQGFLRWAGYSCGELDGDFGMTTLKQTKAFQTAQGLKPDGIVGTTTINKAKAVRK